MAIYPTGNRYGFGALADTTQQLAEATQQDALLAQQQAAIAQQQADMQVAEAQRRAAERMTANQAAYDNLLQAQAAGQVATPNTVSTGSEVADLLLSGNTTPTDDKGRPLGKDTASFFNRKILQKTVDDLALRNNWNDARKTVEYEKAAKVFDSHGIKVNVADRGFTGLIGDTLNIAADSVFGSLAELAATGYALANQKFSNDHSSGKAVLDVVDNARKGWASFKSDEAQDTEKARSQARGFSEMIDVIADNPSGALDVMTYSLGQLFGAKGIGAGLKATGGAVAKAGVRQALSAGAATGKVAKAADALRDTKSLLSSGTVYDDIARAASQSILSANAPLVGIRNAYRTMMGTAKVGAGDALVAAGRKVGNINPLTFAALAEGSGTHNDLLRQDGAFNEDTNRFTDDAMATAQAAGLLTGGITYAAGKLGNTFEGSVARAVTGQNATLLSKASSGAVGKLMLDTGETTVGEAIEAVGKAIAANAAGKETKALLTQVTDFLSSPAAHKQMVGVLNGNRTPLGQALAGANTLRRSMMAEGLEEGLIGFISSVASQGLGKDGNFSADNVDFKRAFEAASSAATLGAMMGVAGAGLEIQQEHKAVQADAARLLREAIEEDGMLAPQSVSGMNGAVDQQVRESQLQHDPIYAAQPTVVQPDLPREQPTPEPKVVNVEAEPQVVNVEAEPTQAPVTDPLLQASIQPQALPTGLPLLAPPELATPPDNTARDAREYAELISGKLSDYHVGRVVEDIQVGSIEASPTEAIIARTYAMYEAIQVALSRGLVSPDNLKIQYALERLERAMGGFGGIRAVEKMMGGLMAKREQQLGLALNGENRDILVIPSHAKFSVAPNMIAKVLGISEHSPILPDIKAMTPDERRLLVRIVDAADTIDGIRPDDVARLMRVPELVGLALRATPANVTYQQALADMGQVALRVLDERAKTPPPPPRGKKAKSADASGDKLAREQSKKVGRNAASRAIKKSSNPKPNKKAVADRVEEAGLGETGMLFHRGNDTDPDAGVAVTNREQDIAVQRATRNTYAEWISSAFGSTDGIVFVSPDHPAAPRTAFGFTHRRDPTRIYIVLDPTRTREDVLWTVAHERLHQGVSFHYAGKSLETAEAFKEKLTELGRNSTVSALVDAMSKLYGDKDYHTRVEEALAELAAARATKKYDRIKKDWGVSVPPSLRVAGKGNLFTDFVNGIKRIIRTLLGRGDKYPISDTDVAEFLRQANHFDRNKLDGFSVPEENEVFARNVSFDATELRSQYWHDAARRQDPAFNALTAAEQANVLYQLAKNSGDDTAAEELAGDIYGGNPNAKKFDAMYSDYERAEIKKQQGSVDQVAANGGLFTAFKQLVRSASIFPRRPDGADYTDDLNQLVGAMGFINGGDVEIKIRQEDGSVFSHVVERGGFEESYTHTWERAVTWVHDNFPDQYDIRDGVMLAPGLYLGGDAAMTTNDIVVLSRAQEAIVMNPLLAPLANRLRKYIPDNWHFILDRMVDVMENMYVYWVDRDYAAKQINNLWRAGSGERKNVIGNWLTDKAQGEAFISRTTDAYGKLNDPNAHYADVVQYTVELISQSKLGAKFVERALTGIEEMVRYPELVSRYGIDDKLVDPHNGVQEMAATGFSFQNRDGLVDGKGALDPGAVRFQAALAEFTPEERAELARIIASVAATNRAVVRTQAKHGMISKQEANRLLRRGRKQLDALFPDVNGLDFGGFYLTMKDDESNPYQTGRTRGRHEMPKAPVKMWQEVQVANIRKAYANKYWGDFIRIVAAAPNKHFAVETARPVMSDVDEGVTNWEWDNKGAQYTMAALVNGIPVRLIAKSKAAERMLDTKRPSELALTFGKINGILSPLKTAYNIAYVPVGIVRDIITGYANIQGAIGSDWLPDSDVGKVGLNAIKYALQSIPNTLVSTYQDRGRTPWLQMMEESGGGIFFGDRINTGTYRSDTLTPRVVNPLLKKTGRAIKAFGYAPEAAFRVGSFQAYMEYIFPELANNPTTDQIRRVMRNPANRERVSAVIQATKNVTTNFQQHGADNFVRFAMAFHNATLQGTFATMPQTLATAHGRKVYGMVLTAGLLTAAMGIAASDEDELGNSKYFSATGRERKLIIGDLAVPIPDEVSIGKVLGDNVVGLLLGKRNFADALVDMANVSLDSVTSGEMGKSGNFAADAMHALTPSFAHGAVALATGYDIFGNPLRKEAMYDSTGRRVSNAANFELSTGSASELGTRIAELLYPIGIDRSGNEIDALGQSVLGGVYGMIKRAWGGASTDGLAGLLGAPIAETTRGFTTHYITREARDIWRDLKERAGVSERNAGTSLDVLNVGTEQEGKRLNAELRAWDKKIYAALSPRGYKLEELRNMIDEADRNGDSATVRDLREEMRGLYDEQERVRKEAFDDMRMKGYL